MKRDVILWLAIVTGPLVWFTSMEANFALSHWACAYGWKPVLYVISLVALAITAGSGMAAWREWKQVGRDWAGEAGGAIPRSRALASGGVAISAMSFLVILAQSVVELVLGACQ